MKKKLTTIVSFFLIFNLFVITTSFNSSTTSASPACWDWADQQVDYILGPTSGFGEPLSYEEEYYLWVYFYEGCLGTLGLTPLSN